MENKSGGYLKFNPLRFSLRPRKPREDRQVLIARAAYFRAERRNFEPGHEVEDWLAAEREVDRWIAQHRDADEDLGV